MFGCVKNTFLCTKNMCYYRELFKQTINMSYSLNAVCQKLISNKRVFRKTEDRNFEVLLNIGLKRTVNKYVNTKRYIRLHRIANKYVN